MSHTFDKKSFDKNIKKILNVSNYQIVPKSKFLIDQISQYDVRLLIFTDFCYFLQNYGAICEKHGSLATLSLNAPNDINSFIRELKKFYAVSESIIPFYWVGSDCLCFDTQIKYGEHGCIKAWNHEMEKQICPQDGISLFVNDKDERFQLYLFSDFIKIIAQYKSFPGIGI
jgi:hypothetical protein